MASNTIEENQIVNQINLTRKVGRVIGVIFINLFTFTLVFMASYLGWMKFKKPLQIGNSQVTSNEQQIIQQDAMDLNPSSYEILNAFQQNHQDEVIGIPRHALVMTNIPSRSKSEIITYTVQTGDTLFSIAEQYKISPATLLWGNFDVLEDNPHLLKPGQILNILPVDGIYYQWKENDNLNSVAEIFKTTTNKIIEFTGNNIDLTSLETENSGIEPGVWVIIPEGKRAIKDWGPPTISRSNPASARSYGPGHCGAVYEGAVGTQSFIWPTTDRTLSGYAYDPTLHPAIDIGGQVGNAIFASDSGVVVYAGWSNYGYGYLIVIDHGFGWQSAYAHLSAVGVSCGQSVFKGGVVGALGNTGNSTGPHLHFEIIYNGVKVNPLDFAR